MENVLNNTTLCFNSEELLEKKRNKILETLDNNVDVFFFYDTETTGLSPYPKGNTGRDRLLEVAFAAYVLTEAGDFEKLEVEGTPVTFQEYINPFAEDIKFRKKTKSVEKTNERALEIHGITNDFLNGKGSLNGMSYQNGMKAPVFADLKPFMERFLCLDKQSDFNANVHFVAHNGKSFDDKMITEEMKYIDAYDPEVKYKRDFESLVSSSIDTKLLMQKLYSKEELKNIGEIDGKKPGFTLDYLSKMLGVDLSARQDVHGGMLDSLILKEAFEGLLKTDKYRSLKNKYKFNTVDGEKAILSIPKMPASNLGTADGETSVLNIVKTDASFHEGTGTVKEYVERAKEAGLDNLVLADTVSLSRFIEFYETCEKEEIKPIVATNFKLESGFDLYNIFGAGKEDANEARSLVLDSINVFLEQEKELTFEELASSHGFDSPEKWGNLISKLQKIQAAKKAGNKLPTGLKKAVSEFLKGSGFSKTKLTDKHVTEIVNILGDGKSFQNFENFDRVTGHSNLLLVAEDNEGYETLKKLISVANRDGQHYVPEGKERGKGEEPLLTMKHIEKYNEGIIAMVGGNDDVLDRAIKSGYANMPSGVIKQLSKAMGGKNKVAVQYSLNADRTKELSVAKQEHRLAKLASIAKEHELMGFAAQNAAFAKEEDFQTHRNKYAILLEKEVTDFGFTIPMSKEEHLRTKEEMEDQFSLNNDLLTNTNKLIKEITLSPTLNVPSLPEFKTAGGVTQAEELRNKAYKGLEKRVNSIVDKKMKEENSTYANRSDCYKETFDSYKERLDYELGIINEMDFPGYFLIKQQMIEFCKKEGIPVGAGRGSAAGSLVVYSLEITDVDPIEHALIFERFLNPERKEMPDIDTDIDGEHREKVLNFLREKYSEDGGEFEGAAYIMTKGTFSAKNTLRMLGKTMGMTPAWCDELAKLISKEPDVKLSSELEHNEILKYRYDTEVKTKRLLEQAMELEKNGGRQVSIGKHAGGIVVGNLISQAPISYVDGIPVVQYDKNDIEKAGAVKFDLLGLGTLAKLDLALKNIIEMKGSDELVKNDIDIIGKNFNFDNFTYNDKETYELLQAANSTNVFQIESNMFKGLLKLVKPENLDEITALVSLGRPGPLQSEMHLHFAESKFDPTKRMTYHPLIDHLMDETHGSIIYQEQVMAIGREMGGFTMGGADKLRKAMGKKKIEEMEKQKGLFIEGAEEKQVAPEVAEEIFETVEAFAGYGFNKSHAMAYSLLTYKMAYLRRHYPTEFMAAVLTVDSNDGEFKKKIAKDIDSMKEVNLFLYTPNINESEHRFKPGKTKGILYGFDGIAGFNKKDKQTVIEARKEAKFISLEDFMKRGVCGAVVEKLIDSGSMDSLGLSVKPNKENLEYIKTLTKTEQKVLKRRLLSGECSIIKQKLHKKEQQKKYQMGSFDEAEVQKAYTMVVNAYKKNKDKLIAEGLDREEKVLSSYVTAHPLDVGGARHEVIKKTDKEHVKLSSIEDRSLENADVELNVAGIIKEVVSGRISKAGNKYAFVEIGDGTKTERIFLSDEGFSKANSQVKEQNGEGIAVGDIIGFDLSFYKKEGDPELKTSVEKIIVPKYNVAEDVSRKKKKKQKFVRRN